MLELKFNDPSSFIKLIDILKDLITSVTISFDDNGLVFKTLDSSHVAFIKVDLKSRLFSHYRCDGELDLSLSLPNLSKVLGIVNQGESLTITATNKPSHIWVSICSEENPSATKNIRVNLLDIEAEDYDMKGLEHSATVRLNSHLFKEIIRKLGEIGDTVVLCCSGNKTTFGTASDFNEANFEYHNSESLLETEKNFIQTESSSSVEVQFANKFLMKFAKAAAISDVVEINLHKTNPSVFLYKVKGEEGEEEEGYGGLSFVLAPVVKTDE